MDTSMSEHSPGNVTRLLQASVRGEESAVEKLLPLVYDELRALAGGYMAHESPAHTLPPTGLVHEAYLRLVGADTVEWQSRAHFFRVAARAMRRVLVDHARRRGAGKRGGDLRRVPISRAESASVATVLEADVDFIALDQALTALAGRHGQKARVVELRYFAGLTTEETARVLQVSVATVEREWAFARAWLFRRLQGAAGTGCAAVPSS